MVVIASGLRESSEKRPADAKDAEPACPVCTGRLIDIRGELRCTQCHTICESACDGDGGGWETRVEGKDAHKQVG